MDQHLEANRRLWDAWTPFHVASAFYDVDGFKAGRKELGPIELAGVGDVRGRSLLHLQCHFGLDTLAWAGRGAIVTGVDFSEPAIVAARALAAELGIDARFVVSDVYALPDRLAGEYDIVFTSHGVLSWLPDLAGWARVVARFLKPGGAFFVVDTHPFAYVFDDERTDSELRVRYPYFPRPEPLREEKTG